MGNKNKCRREGNVKPWGINIIMLTFEKRSLEGKDNKTIYKKSITDMDKIIYEVIAKRF
jgi:hypothetical protein